MYRLTIKDILEATGGVLLCGDENTEIKDVCINSKEIKPGDLFVPIIGGAGRCASFYRERTSHRCGNSDITAYRYCRIGKAVCLRE